jgi:hypothetical protein
MFTLLPDLFETNRILTIIIATWLLLTWFYLMKVYLDGVDHGEINICIGLIVAIAFWLIFGVMPSGILIILYRIMN